MDDDTSMLSCSSNHIARQACSIYNLTLDEVQALMGKPLSSMSLEELLGTVISEEDRLRLSHHHHHHQQQQHNLNLSPTSSSSSSPLSFNLDTTTGKRTVEEVWREIVHQPQQQQQQMLGMRETTLEVFLVRAGIMSSNCQQSEWHQFQAEQHMAALDCNFNYCMRMEGEEEERKRGSRYSNEVIERRQKRMIKNRESAARSRARKQAYTNQLEHQVLRLRKINNWLRKKKEIERLLVSTPCPPEPRYQLRRTTSATF